MPGECLEILGSGQGSRCAVPRDGDVSNVIDLPNMGNSRIFDTVFFALRFRFEPGSLNRIDGAAIVAMNDAKMRNER